MLGNFRRIAISEINAAIKRNARPGCDAGRILPLLLFTIRLLMDEVSELNESLDGEWWKRG